MYSLHSSIIIILCAAHVHGIVHRHGPRDTPRRMGQTATLYCAFDNKTEQENVFWYRVSTGHVLSQNDHVSAGPRPEMGQYIITGNHSNGEYNLQITQVQKSDSDEYRCGYDEDPEHVYLGANLTVMVPPGLKYPACIKMTDRSEIGQMTRLSCVSKGGDPPATLIWQRNGVRITPPRELQNGLKYLMEAEDVGATFTCVAESPAMLEMKSCSLMPLRQLPGVMVLPRVGYTKLGGSKTFKCQKQDQQPGDSYTWYFNDNKVLPVTNGGRRFRLSSDKKTLTVGQITAADNDVEIVCKVYNSTTIIEGATATLSISDLNTKSTEANKLNDVPLATQNPMTAGGRGGNLYVPPKNDNSKTALIAVSIIGGVAIASLACIIYIYIQKKVHRKQTIIPMTPRRNSNRSFSVRSFSARSFSIRSFSGRSFLLRRNSSFKKSWRRNASIPNGSTGSYVALNMSSRRNDKYEDLKSVASCPSFSQNGPPLLRSQSACALPLPPINLSASPLSFRAPSHGSEIYMPNSIASVAISEEGPEDVESCDTYEIIDDKMMKFLAANRTENQAKNTDEYVEWDGVKTADETTSAADVADSVDDKASTAENKPSSEYLEILP